MGPSSPIFFSHDQGHSHLPVSDWTVQSWFELERKFFAELVFWQLVPFCFCTELLDLEGQLVH